MLTLARTGRIDKLSGGLCRSEDFAAVKERMATFMAAGFIAVCKQTVEEPRLTRISKPIDKLHLLTNV